MLTQPCLYAEGQQAQRDVEDGNEAAVMPSLPHSPTQQPGFPASSRFSYGDFARTQREDGVRIKVGIRMFLCQTCVRVKDAWILLDQLTVSDGLGSAIEHNNGMKA